MPICRGWLGTGVAAFLSLGVMPPARAGEPPLMVVVEVGPGVGQEAADIRKAIGSELRRAVVAPSDAAAGAASDLLLVVVSRDRIVLSLHERSDERVTRSIRAPSEAAPRLRAVTWLAGNVARDQMTPLLTLPPAAHAAPEPAVVTPVAEPIPERARAATEPPPVSAPLAPGKASSEAQIATSPPSAAVRPLLWTITAAAGEGARYGNQFEDSSFASRLGVSTQVEVLRHRTDGYLYGLAADFGPSAAHRLGVAVAGGLERGWGRFTLETSLGLGFEIVQAQGVPVTTITNSADTGTTSTTTVTSIYQWEPYVRLFASISHPVTRSWDVVLRVGAHAPVTGLLETSFVASSLGVRVRLP